MTVCSIRRVKDDLDLPPMLSHIIPVALSDHERTQYDQVKNDLLMELSEAIKRGKAGTSIKALAGIRKLRQICCHGLTISTDALSDSKIFTPNRGTCTECGITVTSDSSFVTTQSSCGHKICDACLVTNSQRSNGLLDGVVVCPACEQFGDALLADDCDIKLDLTTHDSEGEVDPLSASRATSKMKAVLNTLRELHGMPTNVSQPPVKSLVFTYWIRALDTIESGRKLHGIFYVRIDGQTPLQQRHDAISQFQTDDSCLVALLTLGTGSVGLNLTAASHVHLVEPHWNPMVEEQAAARAHRIGQTKEVTVHRYIVQNSIEERIRNKQHQKFHLAHLAGVGEDYVKRFNIAREGVDELDLVFEKCQLL